MLFFSTMEPRKAGETLQEPAKRSSRKEITKIDNSRELEKQEGPHQKK